MKTKNFSHRKNTTKDKRNSDGEMEVQLKKRDTVNLIHWIDKSHRMVELGLILGLIRSVVILMLQVV